MNTIGNILKNARVGQNITFSALENSTKIKADFLKKIENEDWDNLPEFPVVSGFVKNIASSLGLSVNNVNAVLRRDYPPKKLRINPKPDLQNKFVWSPKLTFGIAVGTLILIVLGYLGFEYKKFIAPPEIFITSPIENETVIKNSVKIEGKTTTDVILTANNQPITLNQDGEFVTEIDITKDTKNVIFKAVSRSGKVTEKIVNIKVE